MKFICVVLSALILGACGGGGNGGASSNGAAGIGVVPARYAQWELLGTSPDKLIASNTGIYGLQRTSGSTDKVVKWQNTPGADGWLQATMPTTTTAFSPGQTVNDVPGIGLYWAGFRASDVRQIYSYLNAAAIDDIGIKVIVADNGSSGRQWVITSGGAVYRDSTGGGLGTNALNTFDLVFDTGITNLGERSAVSDGRGQLYAAAGTTLSRVGALRVASSWTFPERINTLVYTGNALWIGAGATVYKLSGDTVTSYVTLSGGLVGLSQEPTFCISNLNLYAANGLVYKSITAGDAPPTPTPYINSTGAPDTRSALSIQVTGGNYVGGVYCADDLNSLVFTKIVDPANPPGGLQLLKIWPL